MTLTSTPYIRSKTIDDLMRSVVERTLSDGMRILPTRGEARELLGMALDLENPRFRISRTETRGKPFSCLGELSWYLAQTNDLDFICYYISNYSEYSSGASGYGPRLFNWKNVNQFDNVANMLSKKPDSRQAVIQLFDCCDLLGDLSNVPCTCTLQFMIRANKLHLITYMRSNDAFMGLPHDFFCFTMLQEIMAVRLNVDLGTYRHMVGSLHLYEKDVPRAKQFLNEGWQSTKKPMPPMPTGDPRPHISEYVEAERKIRTTGCFDLKRLSNMNAYWADLVRILLVFNYRNKGRSSEMRGLLDSMSSDVYASFVDGMIRREE